MISSTEQLPIARLEIRVDEEGSLALAHVMAHFFNAGWETLEPLKFCEHCRQYYTTLFKKIRV